MAQAVRPQSYFLRSFGCQMNEHDSERIAGLLEEMGMRSAAAPEDADLLIYNTCSIREKADTRLAGHLGNASRLKKERPSRVIVVAGCLAQSRRDEFFADFPFVDVLVGPQSLHELPGLLETRLAAGSGVGAYAETTTRWSAELPRVRVDGPSAWVQIVAGCSNYCTYCIVPHVRGPEASRPASDILSEVAKLAASGVREITMLGQNVNAYGKEPGFEGAESFADLLESACGVGGIERIRFMTSHPKDMSDALVEVIAAHNQVCEHVHLPVQSGSDRILSAMNRRYDRAAYLDLVGRLRSAVPELTLTTDIIVGFPGETEKEFQETLSLVEECRFDSAFTFIYSPRRGTAAAALPGRLPEGMGEERMARLVDLVQRLGRERNQALVGKTVEVLVERVSRHAAGEVMGRTRGHKPVNFPSAAVPGDLVRVELLEATSTSFRGRET
jgi:tRNA-2-methylthio-N6-dimethylallyladenosine synthase